MRSTIGEINLRIVPIFSDILICSLDPPVLKPIKFISRTTSITGIYNTKCPTTVISKSRQWQLVIDDTGSVERAFVPLYNAQNGDLDRFTDPLLTHSLTHSQTLKERATQLLIRYKSGALVTQLFF